MITVEIDTEKSRTIIYTINTSNSVCNISSKLVYPKRISWFWGDKWMYMVLVKCIGDVGRQCSHISICINGIINSLSVVHSIGRFKLISNEQQTCSFASISLVLSDWESVDSDPSGHTFWKIVESPHCFHPRCHIGPSGSWEHSSARNSTFVSLHYDFKTKFVIQNPYQKNIDFFFFRII